MERDNQNRLEGFVGGLVDALTLRTFWNRKVTDAKKDASYLAGNLTATIINPVGYLTLVWNFAQQNYILKH